MQASKNSRNGSSDAPQRSSPVTPKTARKSVGTDSDSANSKRTPTKLQTEKTPKVVDRRSPRSPATEQRRPSRLSELESQLNQLQDELKKSKDQLGSVEAQKKQARQEAEEVKQQLEAMTAKIEASQNQLMEFSQAEEARLQELRQISQERDRAWQSEIEAIQKQNSFDSAALASAMDEIHRLKLQLETVAKSEGEMAEVLATIEKLKADLSNSEKAEAEAEGRAVESQQQLEVANATVETLRSEGSKLLELFRASISELEESRNRVKSLQETVNKLQDDEQNSGSLGSLETEVEQLRSAIQTAEAKYAEERARTASQLQSAYEIAEQVKSEYAVRESELLSALSELKASLMDKETELQGVADMNEELKAKLATNSKMTDSAADVAELKANLMDKENELQCISEENEQLKMELAKREVENSKSYESVIAEMELAKAKEKEALLKLEYISEEASKQNEKAVKVAEQLDAAQTMNAEMEAELRRLRVQSDQWRKAAEAAAAVLTTGNNGRFVERTSSLDADYQSVAGKLMHSPFSDDLDEESPKKKNNGGVLRKFGLWKKSPK